jgi:hypothetical protein
LTQTELEILLLEDFYLGKLSIVERKHYSQSNLLEIDSFKKSHWQRLLLLDTTVPWNALSDQDVPSHPPLHLNTNPKIFCFLNEEECFSPNFENKIKRENPFEEMLARFITLRFLDLIGSSVRSQK